MRIEFDQGKRDWTLTERGLDFADSVLVFAGAHFTIPDDRRDYGERRYLSFGLLRGRAVTLVWTPRDDARRVISMRYASDGERARFRKHFGGPR